MGSIFLFSIIVGVIITVLLVPLQGGRAGKKEKSRFNAAGMAAVLLITVAATFVFYYLSNLDRNFSSMWIFLIIASGAGAFLAAGKERLIKSSVFLVTLLAGAYLLTAFLFNADEKFESAKMDVKTEIEAFDEQKTPASVPPKFARNKMKKAFGQVPNTSYYELGNLQIQKVNGEYVYIAPVEFSGFFKWFKGDETPGYFTISATDSSANPKFVKEKMVYTRSSYFHKNIERHIRMNYPKQIFNGDVQLEVDENGKPYYVRTYGKFISARNGFEADGIVIVDPQNGNVKSYKLDDAPEFIDGAVSPEAVSLQNSYYGNYVKGFWNSLFGKSDVKLPSDEGTEANVSPIFDENGEMFYFTDFTSPKEGVDSMLGYSLTNSRTGEATFYTGNLEKSYMDSQGNLQIIEKKFIEKKWGGEMPILYNFYGEASWLTPVLDANGFLQNYFIVSAANPEISVYANTPNQALKLYKTALQRGGGSVNGSGEAEEKQVSGTVSRVYKEKTGDYTTVFFLLDSGNSYTVSSENNPMSIYLKENDNVIVTYLDTGESFLPVREMEIEGLE
ncbi:sulfite exporter TauE/SafE family protein [Rossellomorea vietnamensis]|uniref:Sulfite exporter TauE/SafE family protein n=1 Tax=Rossellomorea vietnamensis TaxID=218284 RepID=A0A5D4MDT9_9BACI|nr:MULTISPECIES: sulfite exporter TauE/SafE family protein [Bacillaceae]TYR99786.1 sulfite exporter TauE/SafE family protein [Rossellomorea vietnamensis]